MNQQLLELLQQSEGYCSGEAISEQLGITRSAVWKQINQLRREGYEIDSVPRRGYFLQPGYLNQHKIKAGLRGKAIGRELYLAACVSSTNDWAGDMSGKAADGSVFLAERQTKGRGRRGKIWDSPLKEGLFFSVLLYPPIAPCQVMRITLCAGLAVCKGVYDVTGIMPGIKWPNDIVLNGKKLCGILAEMRAEAERIVHVVIGIGMNVNQRSFPEELKEIATSLRMHTDREWDRNQLAAAVCSRLEEYEQLLAEDRLPIEEYRSLCVTLGREVRVSSVLEEYQAKAVDITEGGELVVELPDGRKKTVGAGEVSVRGLLGYSD